VLIWRLDGEKRRREGVNLSTEGWIEVKENMILPHGLISTPSFSLCFRGERLMHMAHKMGNTSRVLKSSSDWLNKSDSVVMPNPLMEEESHCVYTY